MLEDGLGELGLSSDKQEEDEDSARGKEALRQSEEGRNALKLVQKLLVELLSKSQENAVARLGLLG